MARLRRLSATVPGAAPLPHREASGYLLGLPTDQVDACRFRRLIEVSRTTDDPEQRAAMLRDALALWRGEPLLGMSGEWAEGVRVGLRELRLSAVISYADATLAGPEPPLAAIGELSEAVAEHPLVEPVVLRLMTALARAGRVPEALQVYERTRVRLADELGTDPGPELQRLYGQLLHQDGGPHAAAAPEVPRQTPIAPAVFVGRAVELDSVTEALWPDRGPAPRVVVVHGPGGVGKSALALHASRCVADRFPDGQLYLNLQGSSPGLKPLAAAEALSRLLQSLGVPASAVPVTEEAAAARFRTLLADRRVLLVLDNAASPAQLRPLLPAGAGCAVLATSRRSLFELGDAHHVTLTVLPPHDCVELLVRLDATGRFGADRDSAATLARLCGQLPLALRIAAARARARPDWPLAAFVERLSDRRQLLDQLGYQELSVRACFDTGYQALADGDPLDQEAARAFRLLGLPDGPDISVAIAARLFDMAEPDAERSLDRLVDAQLLESGAPGRYRMHDLIRLYARDLAEQSVPEPDRYAALARIWRCYVATTVAASQLLRPGFRANVVTVDEADAIPLPHRDAALAWLATETPNLLAAAHQAAIAPDELSSITSQLAAALFGYLHGSVQWIELREVNLVALDLVRRMGDRPAEGRVRNDLGVLTWRTGDADGAIAMFTEAVRIHRELGNRRDEARSLANLGTASSERGNLTQAVRCLERALTLYQEVDYRSGQALAFDTLGQIYRQQGDMERAIEAARQGLAIYRGNGDEPGAAMSLRHLGVSLMELPDLAAAVDCLQRAATASRNCGDVNGVVWALTHLGEALRHRGDIAEAQCVCEEALALSRQFGGRQEQGMALLRLGAVLFDIDDRERARACLFEAVEIFEQLGAPAASEARGLLTRMTSRDGVERLADTAAE
ncbi:MAG: BTAD domain-containing putative transcriptional regulator [Micromonosporaceae bacterium]